jgi:hypothetical protein
MRMSMKIWMILPFASPAELPALAIAAEAAVGAPAATA